ncbi:PREDICTED: uncharacterized protein At1g76070-like [Nicotiana attenuata]|uniref:Syringolide-induced protein 14-1-1 n=1 Tax=Nicotiana attenuata TaxID=49451 RepID=A0A314LAS3_NICAT|nr:PREDICTED: uncharacterized protein At1g76070-like [Nicotiana attenuata]OIT38715.1 uncharacterized protein A4A49_06769 [Nicotiana attenuata]
MEKPCMSKKKTIFKLLPKAAAAAVFILQNAHAPFSPSREQRLATDYHHKNHHYKGFAGPIISVIPADQSGRNKSEPSSPKVSCIGQIKHNKKKMLNSSSSKNLQKHHVKKKSVSSFGNIFAGKAKLLPGRKSDVSADNIIAKLPDRAPCLSQMKRFASGREPLTKFDWRSIQITAEDRDLKYYTDDEDRGYSEDEEDEFNIGFPAPIIIGRCRTNITLEPRKEINLWKRRTMNQPRPLQLNTVVG